MIHGVAQARGKASLLLRPERIDLGSGAGGGVLTGEVRDITFLGNNIHVLAGLDLSGL